MPEFVNLKQQCAGCRKVGFDNGSYQICQSCPIYKKLNESCNFCQRESTKTKLKKFARQTAHGLRTYMACPECIAKLT